MSKKRITEEFKIIEFFGCNVFNDNAMRTYLKPETYEKVKYSIDNHLTLTNEIADEVAAGMLEWASSIGATHYTHWFQPLTGATAEKHDSFISIDNKGNTFYEFTGKNLIRGEADASSFPSGGIRATFEARGYTVWDCSSPAFVKKSEDGAGVLYIPTAFCSFTGETLDKKTPLLRSMEALRMAADKLFKAIGQEDESIVINVGGEQEYFLIDINDYNSRPDIKFTGRTLFGSPAPKGQEKDDQYYASIRDRVSSFMADVNEELWKLGITAKTQHNEVAPCQHELAPIYSSTNIATDQNQLIMETLKKVANSHGLACLLHEKPFAGINGSGKHNNWSLSTTKGKNLLKPGKDPINNKEFLLFFTAVISAVDEYADLVLYSASNSGNDQRLGGNEAPPATISIHTGAEIENLFNHLLDGQVKIKKSAFKTGVSALAEFNRDNSDRNRTSPFAFTGNKFEFRMVGSSATLANPNTVLNTITAEMLERMAFEIAERSKDESIDSAIMRVVIKYYNEHKRIIFNGNNYSEEWRAEAKRRGLTTINNCIDCYDCLLSNKMIELYEKHSVMSRRELASRREIGIDNYSKTIHIEATTMLNILNGQIIPATTHYLGQLAITYNNAKAITSCSSIRTLIKKLDSDINILSEETAKLDSIIKSVPKNTSNYKDKGIYYRDVVMKELNYIREIINRIEPLIDKAIWPFPTYTDILFYD